MNIFNKLVVLTAFVCLIYSCDFLNQAEDEVTVTDYTTSFSPSAGVYNNVQTVALSTNRSVDKIYYTIDGTDPTIESELYEDEILIDSDITIKAIAVIDGSEPGEIESGDYKLECADPVFIQSNSDLTNIQVLELSSETDEAEIYYTTDGSDPTLEATLYDTSIFISSSNEIKAIAIKNGFSDSDIESESYEIDGSIFDIDYTYSSAAVIQSSESGDDLTSKGFLSFSDNSAIPSGNFIVIQPDSERQTIDGFGGSFTESAAYALSYVSLEDRAEIMDAYFGEDGANYSLSRIHLGSSDFTVEGNYSYAPTEDTELSDFSIEEDTKGFADTPNPDQDGYDGLYDGLSPVDDTYDLLPMLKEALDIEPDLKIIATPWTAPDWMKSNGGWFGGSLNRSHYSTFALYFTKYLEAYEAEGVNFWAVTPENEPLGNGGQWESMTFTASEMSDFIGDDLGPELADSYPDVKILSFDQNRDHVESWADVILGNDNASQYIYGSAVHWYRSSFMTFNETLDEVHNNFPDKVILNSEACIDSIGDDEEIYSWWKDDSWWWNENATEWGYLWADTSDKYMHPAYTPVHRYARNIIEGLNHWLTGWVDWNIVLDKRGGPNHVSNFCGAPIMIDPTNGEVYYTPIYSVMTHFSRYISPGDTVLNTVSYTPGLDSDDIHATAVMDDEGNIVSVILNTSSEEVEFDILIGSIKTTVTIEANSIQTILID